jgi:hypothetical protein
VILRHPIALAAASILACCATAAQAAEQACLTRSQLSGLILVAAPAALKAVRQQCSSALAPNSPLRDPAGRLTVEYEAAAKEAWPRAKEGLLAASASKANDAERKRIASAMTPDLVGTMLAPFIAKVLSPDACPVVDHVMTLLAPLPPANFSELVVMMAELGEKRGKQEDSPFHLCKG